MAISTLAPSGFSTLQKRPPPPDISPPKPPMIPPDQPVGFIYASSTPWLESKFADGFDSCMTSAVFEVPPMIPTRPPILPPQLLTYQQSLPSRYFNS
ncbi:hypothetical protein KIN20_034709 [Parelaphostrongylus tenuis]|uniref:Uncharacterized protein n=1 Tax=Parelaphostrongylus tenuis TaxID=148309 RepID=A0AAD5WJE1_PARTN|nr:hypothetical protein KIN20_034709 [Parelaphostrongylus tenuis]